MACECFYKLCPLCIVAYFHGIMLSTLIRAYRLHSCCAATHFHFSFPHVSYVVSTPQAFPFPTCVSAAAPCVASLGFLCTSVPVATYLRARFCLPVFPRVASLGLLSTPVAVAMYLRASVSDAFRSWPLLDCLMQFTFLHHEVGY